MTTMLLSLVLTWALAPAPEATEHNKKAMMLYDKGQLALAFGSPPTGCIPANRCDLRGSACTGSTRTSLGEATTHRCRPR